MENEYIVYQSRLRIVGKLLLGVFMILLFLFAFFVGVLEQQWLPLVISIIGFIFFGYFEIYIIKQLFVGRKLVVLTVEGFYDFSSVISPKNQLIPWSQVAKIEKIDFAEQEFVSVYLKNSEEILSELPTISKKLIATNVKMGFGEISINLNSAKKCTVNKLIAKMNRYKALSTLHKDIDRSDN